MSEIAPQLPTDIEALHALVAAAHAERDAAIAERDQALSQIDRLRHLLRQLQRAQFGRRSEKLDPEQLLLALEDIEQAIAGNEADNDKKDPVAARARVEKRRVNRGALPAYLPRTDVTIEPDDTNCPCCKAPMHVIGEETSQRLDVIPVRFRVIVTHRPKYACRACEQAVVVAPAPERLIKGGLPTEAMVAYVLVAKYAWHLPLYRQAQMLLAQGLDIQRAILAFWVGYAAAELKPLYLRLRELILASGKIAVDETVAPVLDPGRGRTKKGYFWAIARDDRPWSGTDPPAIAYSYAPGRGAVHALKLLEHYRGIVQCDGYAAYKTIAGAVNGEAIMLAFCWAHLRRGFFDIAKGGTAPIASEALERIAALYAIEKTIRGKSAGERRAVREEKSKPLVLALKGWFEQQLAHVSGKSLIAEAIRYGLNHWDGLTRFLDDGRIELDTNIVERGIRPIVLNRKNALFAGHDQGAENWACIASLIETCKLHGVDPQAYFTDVLTKLVNLWPVSRLDELMPWAWAAERSTDRLAA
ncbi:MAG TPA: IS66 family transposase [Pseudomonadota bacterium]|nr:IS66 family transposase [Pseudomonadota bacterium]